MKTLLPIIAFSVILSACTSDAETGPRYFVSTETQDSLYAAEHIWPQIDAYDVQIERLDEQIDSVESLRRQNMAGFGTEDAELYPAPPIPASVLERQAELTAEFSDLFMDRARVLDYLRGLEYRMGSCTSRSHYVCGEEDLHGF